MKSFILWSAIVVAFAATNTHADNGGNAQATHTRYGDVITSGGAASDSPAKMIYQGKTIYVNETALSLSIKKVFHLKNSDVLVVEAGTGGNACPAFYSIIRIQANGNAQATNDFGTCSELLKTAQNGNTIRFSLPNAKPVYQYPTVAAANWAAEHPIYSVWEYKDGVLKQIRGSK